MIKVLELSSFISAHPTLEGRSLLAFFSTSIKFEKGKKEAFVLLNRKVIDICTMEFRAKRMAPKSERDSMTSSLDDTLDWILCVRVMIPLSRLFASSSLGIPKR
jgi:hypothetical protein